MRVEVIPNGLDLKRYRPMAHSVVREILNLPQEKKLILFGAMSATSDKLKGFQYLQPALQELRGRALAQPIEVIIFGASKPENAPNFCFPARYMGLLHDDVTLALLYSAADVFVAPSMQDNLPNTVMEALASGTPCVAFHIGGIPDMVEHEKNGYLAQPFDPADLANGIARVLEDWARWKSLSHQAREKVEREFDIELVARRYVKLYEELIG